MSETLQKLDPRRTIQLQGFDAFGAAAALHSASATGFTLSGVFRDQSDFAVLQLFERDDFFGHPRFSYLPDGNFTGIVLEFDISSVGVQHFESLKFPWTDWLYLNAQLTDGTTDQVELVDLATGPGGRTAASTSFTITTDSSISAFDRVTLWYQNAAFDVIAAGGETPSDIATTLASQINGSAAPLSASAVGPVLTITSDQLGDDGNLITMYQLNKNAGLYATPSTANLTGGSSDSQTWHVEVDFDALGWTDIQKLWLTFAPKLSDGAAYADTEWDVTVTNWTVTGANRPLAVATTGSVRIEEDSSWCSYTNFWEAVPDPELLGATFTQFSQGRAVRGATTAGTITIQTHCGSTHDIYLGTLLDADCGIVSCSLDGAAPVTLDCYIASASRKKVRRKLFSSVAAGEHEVVITITGTKNASSSGWYHYFDFLECAVPGDVPDAVTSPYGAATDYDTDHSYKLAPIRVLWNLQQLGLIAEVNHYLGVFYWDQRERSGGSFPTAVITFGGSWADGESIFLTIGGSTIGKSVFPADTSTTIAAHFKHFINSNFVGVWADSSGGVLTLTTRSTGANWLFSLSDSTDSTAGTIGTSGDLETGAVEGEWVIDSVTTPVLNYAARKWHEDFFAELEAAGIPCVSAVSHELVNPDDTWVSAYPDAELVLTATGVGTHFSAHLNFGTPARLYIQQAMAELAELMDTAGLTPRVQFGEVLWWYFANESGMAFYDADTAAAALLALGRPLHTFTGNHDDPSVNSYEDADFLRERIRDWVADAMTYITSQVPGTEFELLWPLDVNDPDTRQLNRYVNLPEEWEQKSGSGFTTFKVEGFQYGGIDHDADKSGRCARYPFTELNWDREDCRYLMGLFYGGWPWQRDLAEAIDGRVPLIDIWAYDHPPLFCWPSPLAPIYGRGGFI